MKEKRKFLNLGSGSNALFANILLAVSIVLFILSFIPMKELLATVLLAFSLVFSAHSVILSIIKSIKHFHLSEKEFIIIAVIVAWILGELRDAALVMIIYRVNSILIEKAAEINLHNRKTVKSKFQKSVARLCNIYTPVVAILCVIIAIVVSIITKKPATWVYRSLVCLVSSCSFFLVVLVDYGYSVAHGNAARQKLIVRHSDAVEAFSKAKTVVFGNSSVISRDLISQLKLQKIEKAVLLTNESENSLNNISKRCRLDKIKCNLDNSEKLEYLEKLKENKNKVIYIGDGIDDDEILAAADASVSINSNKNADISADADNIEGIAVAHRIFKAAFSVVFSAIIMFIAVKAIIITLALLGLAPMWLSVLADFCITVIQLITLSRIK